MQAYQTCYLRLIPIILGTRPRYFREIRFAFSLVYRLLSGRGDQSAPVATGLGRAPRRHPWQATRAVAETRFVNGKKQ